MRRITNFLNEVFREDGISFSENEVKAALENISIAAFVLWIVIMVM